MPVSKMTEWFLVVKVGSSLPTLNPFNFEVQKKLLLVTGSHAIGSYAFLALESKS